MVDGMVTFAIALTATLGLTVPVRRLALHWAIVDQPNARKLHQSPMPLLGGLAIYCGTVLAVILTLDGQPRGQILGILGAGALLLATGILDDRGILHHQVKLFVAMPLAASTLVLLGVRFRAPSILLPATRQNIAEIALTLFWVVGITAAFSILDHMDGLVSGVAAISAFFFAVLALMGGQVLVATLAMSVFGASLGFLRWNFKPAKIFMGDGGAMFLGFMLATLGLKLRLDQVQPGLAWMIPVLVLIIPIFDTTLVSISRTRRGLIPFAAPGKDHTAHRLANLRLGQRGAVLVIYGVGIVFGCVAVGLSLSPVRRPEILAFAVALSAIMCVTLFEYLPYERQQRAARS